MALADHGDRTCYQSGIWRNVGKRRQRGTTEVNKDTAELRQLIEAGFARIGQEFAKIDQRFEKIDRSFAEVFAEQRRHAEAIAEIRGELRGLSAWLGAMDSRFMAIMRPYEPPHRPAAE